MYLQDVAVEVWCPERKREVAIELACEEADAKGKIVKGKPVRCSESCCLQGAKMCMLRALSIETGRRI